HRYMRIVIGNFGPALLEQLHDPVAWRLALIVHIGLISNTENQHTRSIQGFACRVQGLSNTLHDMAGHRSVDLPSKFNEACAVLEFPRLPCQIEGIDRDAVTA